MAFGLLRVELGLEKIIAKFSGYILELNNKILIFEKIVKEFLDNVCHYAVTELRKYF